MGDELYGERERGFTLVELMVVVLIIAILMAIAIPTFLGARQTAGDRATQGNVRNAFSAARIYYNERFRYSADPSEMVAVEPSLTWTTTPLDSASSERSIYVVVFDSPDGGQASATLASLAQWQQGKLSEPAFWQACLLDPPETFNTAAKKQ